MFFLFVFLFFKIPVRVVIDYRRYGNDDNLVLGVITLWGIINVKTELPIIKLGIKKIYPFLKTKTELKQGESDNLLIKKKKRIYLHKLLQKLKDYLPLLKETLIIVSKNKKYLKHILKTVKCRKLYWKSELGLKDPALTGIVSGILWAIKGNVNMFILSTFKFTGLRPCLNISVNYNENIVFNTHFNCIFDFNIGHIISIGTVLVTAIIKGGEKK
ncbi:MAG: hypothetical protein PWP21_169 [Thermosediminibacterales bacterium]|nr:hypothetical protein [Thermosediminibacterales bacterium]